MRLFVLIFLLSSFSTKSLFATSEATDVVQIARSFKDGGHYLLKGSGVPEAIVFKGETILSAAKEGTYCSGFTFAVVMRAANSRGLLKNKSVREVRRFQKEWYGSTALSKEKQAGVALHNLGIGDNVALMNAKPGDFIQLWRTTKSGHSAVFLDWVRENGNIIGIHYRSTQTSTDGIGDKTEYFDDAPGKKGTVIRARTYIARLNP